MKARRNRTSLVALLMIISGAVSGCVDDAIDQSAVIGVPPLESGSKAQYLVSGKPASHVFRSIGLQTPHDGTSPWYDEEGATLEVMVSNPNSITLPNGRRGEPEWQFDYWARSGSNSKLLETEFVSHGAGVLLLKDWIQVNGRAVPDYLWALGGTDFFSTVWFAGGFWSSGNAEFHYPSTAGSYLDSIFAGGLSFDMLVSEGRLKTVAHVMEGGHQWEFRTQWDSSCPFPARFDVVETRSGDRFSARRIACEQGQAESGNAAGDGAAAGLEQIAGSNPHITHYDARVLPFPSFENWAVEGFAYQDALAASLATMKRDGACQGEQICLGAAISVGPVQSNGHLAVYHEYEWRFQWVAQDDTIIAHEVRMLMSSGEVFVASTAPFAPPRSYSLYNGGLGGLDMDALSLGINELACSSPHSVVWYPQPMPLDSSTRDVMLRVSVSAAEDSDDAKNGDATWRAYKGGRLESAYGPAWCPVSTTQSLDR